MFAANDCDFLRYNENVKSDSVPSFRFWRPPVPKSQSDFPFMARCNTHTAHQGSHWGQSLRLSMHELSSEKEQCSKFIEQDEEKCLSCPPMSLLSPHYDTEKLYFIANVHRHKRPIRAWNPLNGLLSNTCVSVFQSTVAAQTRLPWAVRRKGDPRRQGGIPEGALDPQVTHRWSGQEHNGAMMPKGTLSPDPSYMRNPAWNSIDGKNLKCAPLIQEHNKCWKLSSLHARPLDGGVFYVSVSSVAPEMASILKKKYVFKEA